MINMFIIMTSAYIGLLDSNTHKNLNMFNKHVENMGYKTYA